MTRKAPISSAALSQKAETIAKTLDVARAYHGQGQLEMAEGFYRQVLVFDPVNVDAIHMLGVIALQVKNFDDSIRLLKRAHRKSPAEPAILVNLGSAYRQAQKLEEAREVLESAIGLKPDLAEAHHNLGRVFYDLEDLEAAVASYHRALEINPKAPDTHVNLGNALKLMGDGNGALAAYEQAVALAPGLAQAHGNIAAVYVDRGAYDQALHHVSKGVDLEPGPGELRFKRSLILLRTGRLAQGWADYESRYFAEFERIPRFPTPPAYWRGEDLKDKRILLWTEQGLGDEILYGSMIPDVAARAGKVIVECSPRMVPIFKRSFPQASVVRYQNQAMRTTLPSEFDTQIAVTSLGQYFRTKPEDFPKRSGFLKADESRRAALRARYESRAGGNMIVGISWRSTNNAVEKAKSVGLQGWSDILKVPGVTFVNLQYGDCAADLAAARQQFGVEIFQDPDVNPLKSMDDFFAQVGAMDMVVSISNTTVHVAGSLNIPTLVILPRGSGSLWYWFLEGEENLWYSSTRFFRATSTPVFTVSAESEGHWSRNVVRCVGAALAAKATAFHAGARAEQLLKSSP